MPNTKAAKKALRKSESNKISNLRKKRDLLSVIKDYKKTADAGNVQGAANKLPNVFKKLDKAAKINLIKPGKADRLKARLSKRLGKDQSSPVKQEGVIQEDQNPAPEL